MIASSATNGDTSSNPIGTMSELDQYDLGPDTPEPNIQRVFVYGTLKHGHGNHRLLQHKGALFSGPARTDEAAFDLCCNGSFPYALMAGKYHLGGEVYTVDEDVFKSLDRLEGYPRFYNRAQIQVWGRPAWMYFYPMEDGDRFPGMLDGPRLSIVDGVKAWD
jgi:gamma-glutamylcyclotransferase (GGCT)/AIG2-like uncharacterized protein YtfP